MTRRGFSAWLLAYALIVGGPSAALAAEKMSPPQLDTAKVDSARMALRDLWVEHVFWIRNYVVANEAKNAAARDAAVSEVVANAKQIAGAIEPFYGKAAADKLFNLLAGHWGAVKAIADATEASSQELRDTALKDFTVNAKEIATFLSSANPHLPYDTLFGWLSAHGAHHVAQIDQLHTGHYSDETKTWAAMRAHMLVIADALANGLVKQFPEKF